MESRTEYGVWERIKVYLSSLPLPPGQPPHLSTHSAVFVILTFSKVKNLDAHSFFTKTTLNFLLFLCSTLKAYFKPTTTTF